MSAARVGLLLWDWVILRISHVYIFPNWIILALVCGGYLWVDYWTNNAWGALQHAFWVAMSWTYFAHCKYGASPWIPATALVCGALIFEAMRQKFVSILALALCNRLNRTIVPFALLAVLLVWFDLDGFNI